MVLFMTFCFSFIQLVILICTMLKRFISFVIGSGWREYDDNDKGIKIRETSTPIPQATKWEKISITPTESQNFMLMFMFINERTNISY